MWEWVVVVPSGYPWSLQVRREVLGGDRFGVFGEAGGA